MLRPGIEMLYWLESVEQFGLTSRLRKQKAAFMRGQSPGKAATSASNVVYCTADIIFGGASLRENMLNKQTLPRLVMLPLTSAEAAAASGNLQRSAATSTACSDGWI